MIPKFQHPSSPLTLGYHPAEDLYFAGNALGNKEVVVKGKKRKPYFVSSRTGQLTAGDALKGIDAAAGPLLHWMSPTQYVGAIRDSANGKNPLISMLRGNSGVVNEEYTQEHPYLSTLFNMGTDAIVLGGPSAIRAVNNYRYSLGRPRVPEGYTTVEPKVIQVGDAVENYGPSTYNHPGQFFYHPAEAVGQKLYSKPTTREVIMTTKEPIMGSKTGRAAVTPEDLANRKFFPVEEYGKEPIYTREQANEMIKNKQLRYAEDEMNPDINSDITYIEENVGDGPMESSMRIAAKRLGQWKRSPHGRIMETTKDSDYSTKSWKDGFKFALNRHLAGEGTMYPVTRPLMHGVDVQEGVMKPGHILINREADKINLLPTQELADDWNLLIREANEKTGLNFPEAIFEPRTPTLINGKIVGYSNRPRLFGPAFGLLKQQNGGKIYSKT